MKAKIIIAGLAISIASSLALHSGLATEPSSFSADRRPALVTPVALVTQAKPATKKKIVNWRRDIALINQQLKDAQTLMDSLSRELVETGGMENDTIQIKPSTDTQGLGKTKNKTLAEEVLPLNPDYDDEP